MAEDEKLVVKVARNPVPDGMKIFAESACRLQPFAHDVIRERNTGRSLDAKRHFHAPAPGADERIGETFVTEIICGPQDRAASRNQFDPFRQKIAQGAGRLVRPSKKNPV
jgi:hypothetical protein